MLLMTYPVAAVRASSGRRGVTDAAVPTVGDDNALGAIGSDGADSRPSVGRTAPVMQEQVDSPKITVSVISQLSAK